MKTIVITGAKGYVGKYLVHALGQHFNVLPISRDIQSPHYWDIRKGKANFEVNNPIVIHCAALIHGSPQDMWHVNVEGTRHVIEWAIANKAEHFIYFSTGGVYGYHDAPCAESHPIAPIGYYGHTKWIGEQIVRMYHDTQSLPFSILRLFFPFDHEYSKGIFNMLKSSIQTGKHVTLHPNGKPQINPIHIKDIANAVNSICQKPGQANTYNLCGNQVTSIGELINQFETLYGQKALLKKSKIEQADLLGNNALLKQDYKWQPVEPILP